MARTPNRRGGRLNRLSSSVRARIEASNRAAQSAPQTPRTRDRGSDTGVTPPADNYFLSMRPILDIADREPIERRLGTEYIHVTSLIRETCLRRQVLGAQSPDSLYEYGTSNDRIVWAMGRAVETHIRRQYIKGTGGENVFGRWRCSCSGLTGEGEGSLFVHNKCSRCGYNCDNYREYGLTDDRVMIAGSPDFVIKHGGQFVVVEIKSIKSENWDELTSPEGMHVNQAMAYRRLLILNGFENVADYVMIIYANKEYSFRQTPYKEFIVPVDNNSERYLNALWEDNALIIQQHIQNNTMPDRVCTNIECTQAKNCPLVTRCFSLRR